MLEGVAARSRASHIEAPPPPKRMEDPGAANQERAKEALSQYLSFRSAVARGDIPELAKHLSSCMQVAGFDPRCDCPPEVLRFPWFNLLREKIADSLPPHSYERGVGIAADIARIVREDIFIQRHGSKTPLDSPNASPLGPQHENMVKTEQIEQVELAFSLTALNAQYKLLRYGSSNPAEHFLQAIEWGQQHRSNLDVIHCGLPELHTMLCQFQAAIVANDSNTATKYRASQVIASLRTELPKLIEQAEILLAASMPVKPTPPVAAKTA